MLEACKNIYTDRDGAVKMNGLFHTDQMGVFFASPSTYKG